MFEAIYLFIQGCILVLLFSIAGKRARFLYWAAFLIPLQSVSFEWLTLFTWAKLIFPISIIIFLLHPFYRSNEPSFIPGKYLLVCFLLYVGVLTFGWMVYDYTCGFRYEFARTMGAGIAQSTFRYPIQLAHFFFIWGLLLTGIWFGHNSDDVVATIRGYIAGNLFNVITGLYQVAAYYLSLPWFRGGWIMRAPQYNPDVFQTYIVQLGGIVVPRLSGLGGEPKYAGINFVLALFLVLCWQSFLQGLPRMKHWRRDTLLLILGIFMTFSVGAWFAIILCFTYLFFASITTGRVKSFGVLGFGIVFISISLLLIGEATLTNLFEIYISPKINLEEGRGGLASYLDTSLMYFFLENPFGLLVGNGAGGAEYALQSVDSWFLRGRFSVAPAYTLTRLIGDVGIVGILMLIALFMKWERFLFKHKFTAYGHIVTGGFLLIMFGHYTGLYGILLVIGAIIGATGHEIRKTQPDRKATKWIRGPISYVGASK